jgi:hypothetical protein
MTTTTPQIYSKIIEVMKGIDAIGKNRKNQAQHFNFRGIDDVYNELHKKFSEVGVFTVPEVLSEQRTERVSAKGGAVFYTTLRIKYHFFASDGSSVTATVVGEAMDSGDKSSNKCMSIAHKYALLQVFCIPTEEQKDPDAETVEVQAAAAPLPKLAIGNNKSNNDTGAASWVVDFGKYKDKSFTDIPLAEARSYANFLVTMARKDNKPLRGSVQKFVELAQGAVDSGDEMPF